MASSILGDGDRAYLRDVLPEHMERAAPDDLAVELGDDELLQALVVGDRVLRDEDATLGVRRDEIADRADICGSRGSQRHGHARHGTCHATRSQPGSRKSTQRTREGDCSTVRNNVSHA